MLSLCQDTEGGRPVVLWKSVLRVSFNTQVFSTLIYGVLALSVLFAPWPGRTSFIWLPLTLLLIAGWGADTV
ncbi:protein YgfX [Morganella morganii]|nr:protein YgfX [Morganella morganii]